MTQAPGILAGELGLLSLFDVGQLLMFNRATGVLTVTREAARVSLMFNAGQLVNAVDEQRKQGVEAAYQVFAWKHGQFEFRSLDVGSPVVILDGTESIMLEAARRMDESSAGAAAAGVQPETAKLVEHQSRFDMLRDEFSRVTREAVSESRRAPEWSDPWLDVLQMPGDRLLARPGCVPRLHAGGGWQPVEGGDAPMDAEAFEELKQQMLAGVMPDDSAATWRRVVRHRGRAFAVTLVRGVNECLWIAPAVGAAVMGEPVTGPFEALDALLSQPAAILLAGAPAVDAAHSLLRALIVRLSDLRGITIVVVTDDLLLSPPESMGVVLPASPAETEAVVRSARPGAIAIDALCALEGSVFTSLATTPIVLGAVVASQPEAVVPRWLMRCQAADLPRLQSLLESTPVAVALGSPSGAAGAQSFTVHRVSRAADGSGSRRDPLSPVDLLR